MSVVISTTLTAQITFTYDAAGNRISRALVIKKVNTNKGNTLSNDIYKNFLDLDEDTTIDNVKVVISPNPNGGKFSVTINSLNKQPNKIEIYLHTMLGKQIYHTKQATRLTTIDITNRKNGTYILTVVVNGTKETWKVIKQ